MFLGASAAGADAGGWRWSTTREHTAEETLDGSYFDTSSIAESLRGTVVDVDSAEVVRDATAVHGVEVVQRGTGAASSIAQKAGEVLQDMLVEIS